MHGGADRRDDPTRARHPDPVVSIADDLLEVEPGAQVTLRVKVRNIGTVVTEYRLEVLGEARRWSDVVPARVSVLPGAEREHAVDVVFRPPPAPSAPVGTVPFGVRCVSMEDPEAVGIVEGDLTVGAVQGLDARVVPEAGSGARTGRFRVELRNTGTRPLTVGVTATDPAGLLRFVVAPREATLAPGGVLPVFVAVQPRAARWFGKPVTHNFSVGYRVAGSDRSGDLAMSFVQRPAVRPMLVVLAVVLAGVLAGAFVWLRSSAAIPPLEVGAPPAILEPTVTGDGPAVTVVWTRSPYATGYEVLDRSEGGGTGLGKVDGADQTMFRFRDVSPGAHCYRVRAVAGDAKGAYSEESCFEVTPDAETASPTPSPAAPDGVVQTPTGTPFEPLRWYVLFAVYDSTGSSAEVPRAKARELETAGARGVRVGDSRDSAILREGTGDVGLWVVYSDNFATEDDALAECAAFRAVAATCSAQPGEGAS